MILVDYVWFACVDWLLVHSWYSQKEKHLHLGIGIANMIEFWGIWCTSSSWQPWHFFAEARDIIKCHQIIWKKWPQEGPRLFEDWSPKKTATQLALENEDELTHGYQLPATNRATGKMVSIPHLPDRRATGSTSKSSVQQHLTISNYMNPCRFLAATCGTWKSLLNITKLQE